MKKRCALFAAIFILCFATAGLAQGICDFRGNIDLSKKRIEVILSFRDGSSIALQGVKVKENNFHLESTLSHVKTWLFDTSSVIESSVEIVKSETGQMPFMRGVITSKYSLINYKPARELTGYFEIKNDKIYLNHLSWAGFVADGFVGLNKDFDIELSLHLVDVAFSDLAFVINCEKESFHWEGEVSGRIDFSGTWQKPILSGKLLSHDGLMGNVAYENMMINFNGAYPVIQLTDSEVVQKEGPSFNIGGNVDLTEQCNFMKTIAGVRIFPLIDEGNLYRQWTIKRNQDSEGAATEFKYRLQKSLNDGSAASKEDADMFSIERNIRF